MLPGVTVKVMSWVCAEAMDTVMLKLPPSVTLEAVAAAAVAVMPSLSVMPTVAEAVLMLIAPAPVEVGPATTGGPTAAAVRVTLKVSASSASESLLAWMVISPVWPAPAAMVRVPPVAVAWMPVGAVMS